MARTSELIHRLAEEVSARYCRFTRLLLHAYSYTPTLTRLLLHACSYTPTLTRLLVHAYCRRVCNYLLLGEPIGKGSFGTIWRARMAGGGGADGPSLFPHVTRLLLHAYTYTPTLTRLHINAYSYTPTLARLLLHAYTYTPALTRLLLHAYFYTPTLTRLLQVLLTMPSRKFL